MYIGSDNPAALYIGSDNPRPVHRQRQSAAPQSDASDRGYAMTRTGSPDTRTTYVVRSVGVAGGSPGSGNDRPVNR